MKKFLMITLYKLKLMLADRLFFSAMVIIPLFIMVATGYALRSEKYGIVPVAFVDGDHSAYSRLVIARTGQTEGLKIFDAGASTAAGMLENKQVEAVFSIREGFMQNIETGQNEGLIDIIKSPSSFSTDYVREVVAGQVMRLIADHTAANWVADRYEKLGKPAGAGLKDEVIRYTDSLWEPEPLMTVDYRELGDGGAIEAGIMPVPAATAASAGLIVAFLMFYVLFSSGWLVEERVNGTLKRLVAGPGALGYSFAGSVGALMVSGAMQLALFAVIDRVAFGVRLFPGPYSYLVLMAYLLAVISISMLLSSVLRTPSQLQAGAPAIALATGFAGGCFWNFVEMPSDIIVLSLATPQGWAMKAINALLADTEGIGLVLPSLLVLFTISLILLPLSYIIIKAYVTR